MFELVIIAMFSINASPDPKKIPLTHKPPYGISD